MRLAWRIVNTVALLVLAYWVTRPHKDHKTMMEAVGNLADAVIGDLELYQMLDERVRALEGRGRMENLPQPMPPDRRHRGKS